MKGASRGAGEEDLPRTIRTHEQKTEEFHTEKHGEIETVSVTLFLFPTEAKGALGLNP